MKMKEGKLNQQDLKVISFYTAFIAVLATSIFIF